MRQPPFHVWVCVTGWHPSRDGASPGILLDWRKSPRGGGKWEAYVISASSYSTGIGHNVQVTKAWHLAEHVRPMEK